MSITPIQATPARQYKGMRYVPIFDGNWDNTKDYEPLIIVSYQGNSYTSRTFVPAGTDITNEAYWALTGNYNAQVEAYRQEVLALSQDFDEVKKLTDVFFNGDYNITRFTNSEESETFIYWRFISKEYQPKLAYDMDGVDYGVKMACENAATCAINASRYTDTNDFFGYFRSNHNTIHLNDRQSGSNSKSILCFKNDILSAENITTSTADLDALDYEWSLTGFETLIENGTPIVFGDSDYHPRSFIAQTSNGDYIIGCSDGRSPRSAGLTLDDVNAFLATTGYTIQFAYSLDGGGSVTLVEKGERVNSFINNENRAIKSIIYFAKSDADYNDYLKSCVSKIDTDYRSRRCDLFDNQGDFRTYGNYIENDVTATTDLSFYDLGTRKREASLRFQKDRCFLALIDKFSSALGDGVAYNILDIFAGTNPYIKFKDIFLAIIPKSKTTTEYNDTLDVTENATGYYKILISTSEVATSLGMTIEDYGHIALLRFRTIVNFDIIMTRRNIFYRYDNGTLRQLNNN